MQIVKGSVVRSKSGHDKGCYFIVINTDIEYAFICDGKKRPMEKLKKKKFKHLFVTKMVLDLELINTNKKIRNKLRDFSNILDKNSVQGR